MTIAEAFAVSAEERARIETAPFRGADDAGWRAFAAAVHEQVLAAYVEREITLERALEIVWSCSAGCSPENRAVLLALTARRALQNPPRAGRRRRIQNPTWVRNSVLGLIGMLHENRPEEPIAPNEMNEWTTPILEEVISWFVALGLCERSLKPRTVYQWYLDSRRNTPPSVTLTA